MEHLARPVIEKAPHVMFYEDTDGKTPLDLIIEKQLYGFLEGFMSSYTRDRQWQPSSPIVQWPLFAFGADYGGLMHTKDPYKSWEISQELIKSLKSQQYPRKLVTQAQREEIAQMYV